MITFPCPSCSTMIEVADFAEGRTGKCVSCGAKVVVPAKLVIEPIEPPPVIPPAIPKASMRPLLLPRSVRFELKEFLAAFAGVPAEIWKRLHVPPPWLVAGLFGWLFTIGAKPGLWVPVNYGALAIAAVAGSRLLARRYFPRWTGTVAWCAAIAACIVWAQFDRYSERYPLKGGGGFSDVTYDRFSTPLHESLLIDHPAGKVRLPITYEGPLDSHGDRHGRWEMRDFYGDPGHTFHWYFHGKEVTAIEYQAMIRD